MSYNTEQEPIYKDLTQVLEQRREYETLVMDFSRGTKDVSQKAIEGILEHLRKVNQNY